jgi:tetratricopeptide (TPR) repeat protein
MATIYNLTGRYLRALLKLYRSEKELPERWETRFALGITWGLIGHAKLSAGYFVDSMLPNKEIYMYNPLIRDEAQIWDFLGMAFFDQGKKYEAKVAWKRALEVEKSKDKKDILQQRIEILKRLTDD